MTTPDQLLDAYANGYFPMALNRDDPELYWFSPEERGVIPLDTFNIPRGLSRAMKKHRYLVTVDTAFEEVIRSCGTLTKERRETWINENIVALYTALFRAGHAHSVEVWSTDGELDDNGEASSDGYIAQRSSPPGGGSRRGAELGHDLDQNQPPPQPSPSGGGLYALRASASPSASHKLVGGLYGVSLGAAFFGESMFSRAPDASKIALVRLVEILREAGYELLDAQYVNEHLKQFGMQAWSKQDYMTKLEKALRASPNPSTRFSTASVRSGAASSSSLS